MFNISTKNAVKINPARRYHERASNTNQLYICMKCAQILCWHHKSNVSSNKKLLIMRLGLTSDMGLSFVAKIPCFFLNTSITSAFSQLLVRILHKNENGLRKEHVWASSQK